MATELSQKCKQAHPGRVCDYDEKGECAETIFLSSANLTEFAFNLNMELGVLIKGGSLPIAVETHFRTLIATGYSESIIGENSNESKV
jgi:hypothetical protein